MGISLCMCIDIACVSACVVIGSECICQVSVCVSFNIQY